MQEFKYIHICSDKGRYNEASNETCFKRHVNFKNYVVVIYLIQPKTCAGVYYFNRNWFNSLFEDLKRFLKVVLSLRV